MKAIPTILVIDDSNVDRAFICSIIRAEGFNVLTAIDGESGYRSAKEFQPDLILLDIYMPRMDGYETIKALKSDPVTSDIPVIFLSGADSTESKVLGLNLGAVDFITKPVDTAELLARVRVHLKIKQAFFNLIQSQREQLKGLELAQRAMLPRPEQYPEAGFWVCYSPLHSAGGDFFDLVRLSDGVWGFFLADVSGHDLGSAFVTSALKVLLRQNFTLLVSLRELLYTIQKILCPSLKDETFVTCTVLKLNRLKYKLNLITSGTPPVVVLRGDQEPLILSTRSHFLCAFEKPYLEEMEVLVKKNDLILVFSDGLIEYQQGRHVAQEEGIRALVRHALSTNKRDPKSIVEELVRACMGEGFKQEDDITLMAIKV
jgi:sigma-B regulation protein RsbU (phosphoserine phosphatase)